MKKFFKILAVIVALIIIALLALPMFISADYLKAQLIAQVKNATGRDLIIKGGASLKVFPNIAVSVEDVTLGNPAGFSGPYLVHIQKLNTGAALGPLLHKQLAITGVDVEGMVLNLEQAANGAKNWDFAGSKQAAQPASAPAAKTDQAASPLNGFTLGDVTLKDSSVSLAKAGAKPLAVSGINITLSGADGSTPLKLDGQADYQKQTIKLTLNVDRPNLLLSGKPSKLSADISLPSGKIDFTGTATMKDQLSADGVLNADISDLPALLAWATAKPASAGLPKHIALKSNLFVQNPQAIALKDFTLSADELTTTGKLALDMTGAVPSITGAVKIATLDLDTLPGNKSPAATAAPANTAPASAQQEGWATTPIDASGLRAANANLDLAIGKLISGKVEVSDIAAKLLLSNGVAKFTLANANLYNGTAKAAINLDGSSVGVGFTANVNLTGVQLDPLITALSGQSRLQGKADIAINATGRGGSERAIVSSLGGNGSMKIADGAIKGINIAQFLRDAKKGFVLGDHSNEATDFTALTMSYTMAQGVLTSTDLSMLSPVLRLAGTGTVSLPPKTINYKLTPTIVGTLQGQGGKADAQGFAVPLIISGPWSAPSITPDIAGMLKDPAALKQNLNNLKDGLKDYNSPKDLKRALLGGITGTPAATTPAATAPAPATTAAPDAATTPATSTPAPAAVPEKKKKGLNGFLDTLEKSQQQ